MRQVWPTPPPVAAHRGTCAASIHRKEPADRPEIQHLLQRAAAEHVTATGSSGSAGVCWALRGGARVPGGRRGVQGQGACYARVCHVPIHTHRCMALPLELGGLHCTLPVRALPRFWPLPQWPPRPRPPLRLALAAGCVCWVRCSRLQSWSFKASWRHTSTEITPQCTPTTTPCGRWVRMAVRSRHAARPPWWHLRAGVGSQDRARLVMSCPV